MFQTERVPVTVYRSTDEGAPQLSAAAGSLKTVLKACLTNGYGTKQPLGWEMQYEDGHAACWRSQHNRATGAVLSLDDKGGYGLGLSLANLSPRCLPPNATTCPLPPPRRRQA